MLPRLDYPLRTANRALAFTQTSMTQGSKQGACSSHTDSAKSNCLKHNRREQVPGYVNPHLTHNNRTIFEADCIRDRKSIAPLIKQAEKLYSEKTGQKCQRSFAAFRESVLVVREGVNDSQLQEFIRKAEALTGWKAVGCWLHLDEGHAKSKYIEGQEGFALNAHAHVLWDCQDHQTGKSIKCTRKQLSSMQDLLASATGMERGNKAAETGIKHRSSQEQRIKAQDDRIADQKTIIEENDETLSFGNRTLAKLGLRRKSDVERENDDLKTENDNLKTQLQTEKDGRAADRKAAATDKATALQKAAEAAETAKNAAVEAERASQSAFKALVGKLQALSTYDATRTAAEALKGKTLNFRYSTEVWGGSYVGLEDDWKYRNEIFEPLCEAWGCHNVPRQDFAIGRRRSVASAIVIAAIRLFDTAKLNRIADALGAMAEDFNLEKYKARSDQDAKRGQDERQDQERSKGWSR